MKNQNSPRVFLGLLFVIIGALLLLRITNIDLPFLLPDILFKWPMILVVLGVFFFFSRENKTTGLILFAIGAVFLLQIAFNISLRDIFNYAIPVLLVIVGLALILPRHRRKKKRFFKTEKNQTDNNLEAVDIFSGGSRVITSENFEGGELVCIFAGTEVYFKETVLAKGENVL